MIRKCQTCGTHYVKRSFKTRIPNTYSKKQMYINQGLAMSAERRANVLASAKHSRSSHNEGRDQTTREKSKKKSKPEKYATNGRKY